MNRGGLYRVGLLACALLPSDLAHAQTPAPQRQYPTQAPNRTPTQTLSAKPVQILGVNPPEVEPGSDVEVQLSRQTLGDVAIVVGGVPVRAVPNDQRVWWKFPLPAALVPGTKVEIVVTDAGGRSESATLAIRPLRIEKVEPLTAWRGDVITLTMSFAHPLLSEASVQFSDSNGTSAAAARLLSEKSIAAIVPIPQGIAGRPVQLTVVVRDVKSVPFDGFSVPTVFAIYRSPFALFFSVATLIGGAYVALRWRLARKAVGIDVSAQAPPSLASTIDVASTELPIRVPPLRVPDEVVRACATGDCVLYGGAGLAARAGFPTWHSFVADLLAWAIETGCVERDFGSQLEVALKQGSADRVADSVVSSVRQRQQMDSLHAHLQQLFTRPVALPDVHRLLSDIRFGAVLTTNFDNLLERTFSSDSQPLDVYVPSDIDKLRGALAQRRPFVLKLYGDLNRPQSLVIAPAEYEEKIQVDRPFADFVQQLFLTKTILFLGASLGGIDVYLRGLRIRNNPTVRHYAVVAVDRPGWETDADALERRYGIKVLPYNSSRGHAELLEFVKELRANAAKAAREDTAQTSEANDRPLLKRLEFNNVGPFESLKIDFVHRWTILLGDNGVGKSTILKALAVAVLGDKAGPPGGRLMRRSQDGSPPKNAEIIVTTNSEIRYVTDVEMNSLGQPEVRPSGATAFGGTALVLAFPAMRTISSGTSRGPQRRDAVQSPAPDDVLPILSELPDRRILEFKQWFVDLDYLKRRDAQEAPRVDAILDGFSKKIALLLGDLGLGSFDVAENNVFVETRDGRLPLDALSQGTVSILGWVGVLTQRLIEVTGSADGQALVLIDEIDAHMHPEWQQAIVSRLRQPGAFPNVQFVVSTHSPFLAVGRQPGEIIRVRRDPATRKAMAEQFERDTSKMTVSDVLTSYLFGLQSQVDHDLQQDVLEMRKLSVKPKLSEEERTKLGTLEERLRDVGVASVSADPLYGRYLDELTKAKKATVLNFPPLTKEEEEEQLRETKRILAEIAAEEDANPPHGAE